MLALPASYAQIGGRHVYDFLNLVPAARIAALGGVNVSLMDDDVNMGYQNPALVNDSMHHRASLSYSSYLADIGYGYAAYSRTIEGVASFHTGIHYVSYGEMQGADEFGNLTNTFSANDIAWIIGFSRQVKGFRYGSNLKVINSTLADGFSSLGVAVDVGTAYRSKNKLFSAGLVMKNMGAQLTTYTGSGGREPLPFEIQMGISNKLKYMPLRFSLTATNLEHPNLIFDNPDDVPEVDLSGNEVEQSSNLVDNIFRHAVFSGEFLLGRAVRLRGGYNHLRRQELRSEDRAGLSGFSLGFGLRISRIAIDYGYASFGAASAFNNHQFSLRLDLNKRT